MLHKVGMPVRGVKKRLSCVFTKSRRMKNLIAVEGKKVNIYNSEAAYIYWENMHRLLRLDN